MLRKLGIKVDQRSYKKQKEKRKKAEGKFGISEGLHRKETFSEG